MVEILVPYVCKQKEYYESSSLVPPESLTLDAVLGNFFKLNFPAEDSCNLDVEQHYEVIENRSSLIIRVLFFQISVSQIF